MSYLLFPVPRSNFGETFKCFANFYFILKNDKVYKESAKREKDKSISRDALLYLYDPAQKKLDEEKSKHASLPEENGFGSA
jgi:hypothetical protein